MITIHEVDDRADDAGRRGEVRVQRDVGEEADAAEVDAERRAGVEPEPAEPQDDHAERGERHVVARDRLRLPVDELADARPEEQRSGEPRERALVVDDRRAGEVLHALREQPAVRAPDPVRHEGVDEREDDPEHDVHPEPRPLGHRAPDDRERDRRERHLEEVAGRAGNRREPRERRRPDGEELVHGRHEAGAADEPVAAVAEGETEADEVVDDRDHAEDQNVLGRDVTDVLHPRQPCLEEGEAGLHEEHEDRREDDPDRARGKRELLGAHTRSTSSSR